MQHPLLSLVILASVPPVQQIYQYITCELSDSSIRNNTVGKTLEILGYGGK